MGINMVLFCCMTLKQGILVHLLQTINSSTNKENPLWIRKNFIKLIMKQRHGIFLYNSTFKFEVICKKVCPYIDGVYFINREILYVSEIHFKRFYILISQNVCYLSIFTSQLLYILCKKVNCTINSTVWYFNHYMLFNNTITCFLIATIKSMQQY